MAARYLLLRPHVLPSGNWISAGAIITEGVEIPFGWIPSIPVDPQNTDAVNAYYAVGPRDDQWEGIYYDSRGPNPNFWTGPLVIKPTTFWQIVSIAGPLYWVLTGLGAALAPIPIPGTGPIPEAVGNGYVTEDGVTSYVAEDGSTFYVQES
jgi:hypothetical protein